MDELKHSDDFLARWLNNELTEDERKQFEVSEDYELYQQIADQSAKLRVPEYDTEAAFESLKKRRSSTGASQAKIFTFPRMAMAASVLLVALTLVFVISGGDTSVTFATNASERNAFTFPDGSSVVLNAGSSITFDKASWEEARYVELDGEGFFSVISGEEFTVQTDLGSVTVLGTEFNVRSRSTLFDATCYSGLIEVKVDSIQKRLSPGNEISFAEGIGLEERSVKDKDAPSWVRGITSLNRVPLRFALIELSIQFGITVELEANVDTMLYTGSFPNNDVQTAVQLVLDPFDLEYTYDPVQKVLAISSED